MGGGGCSSRCDGRDGGWGGVVAVGVMGRGV